MEQHRFEETLPAGKGLVDIDVESGTVRVQPHDGRTVVVAAEVENSIVTVTRQGHTVHIRAEQERQDIGKDAAGWIIRLFKNHFHSKTRLTIYVPRDCEIKARTTTGSIHCGFPLTQQRRQRQFIGDKLRGNLGSGKGRIKAKVVTGSFNLEQKKAAAA